MLNKYINHAVCLPEMCRVSPVQKSMNKRPTRPFARMLPNNQAGHTTCSGFEKTCQCAQAIPHMLNKVSTCLLAYFHVSSPLPTSMHALLTLVLQRQDTAPRVWKKKLPM